MMKSWQWAFLVASVTAGAAIVFAPALGDNARDVETHYGWGRIASGDWTFGFANVGGWIETSLPVTGFAFGPGRAELAYCGPTETDGASALWAAQISVPEPKRERGFWGFDRLRVTPRLVATAPAGAVFRGPVWWSPDGSQIALRACEGELGRLVIVDYLSGEITAVPESDNVVEVAWSPGGAETALVREEEGKRSVWVHSRETGESRRLGAGGYDLRWSLDGSALHWLRDDSEKVWTAVRWDLRTSALEMGGPRPARTEGALWSPDGQLCATLQPAADGGEDRIVVYPVNSTVGETLSLPGLKPEKLLGWSPDSRFLLTLAGGNMLAAVSARPPGSGVTAVMKVSGEYRDTRAIVSRWPIDTEAGPPTWSSSGELLVCVDGRLGGLDAYRVRQEYLGPSLLPGDLERQLVKDGLKRIALGMLMYVNDYDHQFPYSDDVDYIRGALDPYVMKDQSVFMRPGTDNSVVVSFTIDAGTSLFGVEDPATTPMATIDYSPEFYGIAYMDGHVEMFEKE